MYSRKQMFEDDWNSPPYNEGQSRMSFGSSRGRMSLEDNWTNPHLQSRMPFDGDEEDKAMPLMSSRYSGSRMPPRGSLQRNQKTGYGNDALLNAFRAGYI